MGKYISNLEHNFNFGVSESSARLLLFSEILQSMHQSSNVVEIFPEITSKLLNLLQVVHVSIYQLDKFVSNQYRTEISGQILAEAIAPNCGDCSQIHIENILCEEYQWGQEISGEIVDFYAAGRTKCDLKLAEKFTGKAYLLIPIVLSAAKVPLWGFLTVHQCTALNEKVFQGNWDQDDVLMLQQIVIQIEIILQREHDNIQLREQIQEAEQAYSTLYRWMEQYRNLVEEIPSVSYVSPIANTLEFAYISPQLQTLLGIPHSTWNAGFFNDWTEYVHPDDRDRVQQGVLHTVATGEPFCCEYRMIANDNKIIWVCDNARMGISPDGKTKVLRGSAFDISDRKQIEQALTKSEAMLEKAQQIAKLGNWEWNVSNNEIIWSKELFHIFERDPALGTPNYEEHLLSFIPEDRQKLDQLVQKAVSHGESYRIELRILKFGQPYYLEAIGHVEYDDNQQVSKL